jgi:hypothetical protein
MIYEIHAYEEFQLFQIFSILEYGRKAQRSLVYSSDSYQSFKYFENKTVDRDFPFITNGHRAGGNMFGNLFKKVFIFYFSRFL